jgi:hypothetical protein
MNLFTQIHEIVFHGKGGYDWETVYSMPIWLRKFTFFKIQEFYSEESKAAEQASQGKNKTIAVDPSGKVNAPAFAQASKPLNKMSYK